MTTILCHVTHASEVLFAFDSRQVPGRDPFVGRPKVRNVHGWTVGLSGFAFDLDRLQQAGGVVAGHPEAERPEAFGRWAWNRLRERCLPDPTDDGHRILETQSSLLFARRFGGCSRAFYMAYDGWVAEIRNGEAFALGSGREYALGAWHATTSDDMLAGRGDFLKPQRRHLAHLAAGAVEVACELDSGSREPVTTLWVS